MKHLTEEELIACYYREGSNRKAAERHLRECGECNAAYEALRGDLAEIKPEPVPERGAGYGESVWRAIRNSAPVYETGRKRWNAWPVLKYIGVCAVLVAVFFLGRHWERSSHPPAVTDDAASRQRLALAVLGDHLDRSERLLVELKHAGGVPGGSPIQAEARELLAENRLYRETATQLNDPMLSSSLDHLERVLVEVANHPDGFADTDVERLQKEMNSDGLLFEIRVLRTRVMAREKQNVSRPKGVSI